MAAVEVDEGVLLNFAQKLASNEKKFRDRAVKKLKKWLQSRSSTGFTEVDLLKLWKGLHYCMWMSDKPLVQEELAATLSDLIHAFENDESSMIFIDTFIQTEAREWYGIDKFRIDKFMMLVRKFLHQSFVFLKKKKWNRKVIKQLMDVFSKSVVNEGNDSVPDGLKLHFADIYVEELEKVAVGEINSKKTQLFLEPYCVMLSQVRSKALFESVMKNIFMKFVDQVLDEEFEEEEDEEEDEESEEDKQSKVPKLEVDFGVLADRLFELASSKSCLGRNRKDIYELVKVLKDLAADTLPEPETESEGEEPLNEADIKSAMQRLGSFENNLMKKTGKTKKKKRKKENTEDDEDEVPKSKKQKLSKKEKKQKGSQENGEVGDKKKKSLEKKKVKNTENGLTKVHTSESKKVKKSLTAPALMNGSVATSTPLADSSNKKSLKKGSKNSEAEQNLFQGGFFDDENDDRATKKQEKKKENKSKKVKDLEKQNEISTNNENKQVNGIEENVSEKKISSKNIENKKESKKRRQSLPTDLKGKKSSESEEIVFTGGFFDDDDEDSVKVKSSVKDKSSKKEAKKRRKSMPAAIEKVDISKEKPSKKKSRKSLDLISSGDNELSNGVDLEGLKVNASDKKKKQSAFKVVTESSKDADADVETPQKSGKKKKDKTPQKVEKSEWDQPLQDGEVEIFVASKKYQKKKNEGDLSLNTSQSKNTTPKQKKASDFAKFDQVLKTPPAFVRKAVDKSSPKQSTGKKTKVAKLKDTPSELTASGKKKVFFAMNKNKAQDFNDSLVLSPVVPFDPEVKPDQGILKTPTSSPASKKSPNRKEPMQKLVFQKRAKAADFF